MGQQHLSRRSSGGRYRGMQEAGDRATAAFAPHARANSLQSKRRAASADRFRRSMRALRTTGSSAMPAAYAAGGATPGISASILRILPAAFGGFPDREQAERSLLLEPDAKEGQQCNPK
jgi:hypothetical protein